MAPAQVAVPAVSGTPTSKATTQATVTEVINDNDDSIKTVDALVRSRARRDPHAVVVSYPSSGIEFVDYTMQQLDVFAYRVARHYQPWIPSRKSSDIKPTTVAILGPSNLDYLVTMLALAKLGHTVLFLSTRLSAVAIESLIETTGATSLLTDPKFTKMGRTVKENKSFLQLQEIANASVYNFLVEIHADTRLDQCLDPSVEAKNNIFIIHSSGSTGLPKPIYQPNYSCLANYAISMDMKAFITLPLYHNHGICNFFRAIHSGKSIHMYNADLPLTQPYLTSILRKHKFEIFYGVPYALKLLAETDEGIELLKELQIVMYGGSACPDTLGNLLVEKGVNLVGHYGATEVGQLMTSFRPKGDKAWNYVRENEKLKPFLKWIPQGPKLFECTVTEGWPAKVASNRPDGSYATKDLFEAHPTIPGAWKYIARLDDTLVLNNGEKFNPVALEGRVRSHRAVTEAVVFGAGRPYLGVLVVPSPALASSGEETVLKEIMPVIQEANNTSEAYARITRDMVKILPADCDFPRTDKGSIIRQAFYKKFANEINEAYDSAATSGSDLKTLNITELQEFLRGVLSNMLPEVKDIDANADFFSLGVDSLQSIQMRTEILKNVDIQGKQLGQNVVFENPSITALSTFLYGLRTGQTATKTAIEDTMQDLISKYSKFIPRTAKQSVVVTGATGSLGAHVVAQLASRSDIGTIYTFVRARSLQDAKKRVQQSLIQRRVYHNLSLNARRKIAALPIDLSQSQLGLTPEQYTAVTKDLRSVIHCAWSVNFNIGLASFEKDCIAGVRHLLDLCQAVPSAQPATFEFCSSVSTVARCPESHTPETLPSYEWAQDMGYAQSKLVAEHICMEAAKATGVKARVLRVGQIVADTEHGIWNATEGIPLIMQTAVTVGALPKLQETPSWTPVDIVAKAVSEIALSDAGSVVANVTNAKTFDWTHDLLPALHKAGLQFEEVEPKEWVKRLRASNPDPAVNPPMKLVDFFASKYDRDTFSASRTYETSVARHLSPSLDKAPALTIDFVKRFVDQFQSTSWKQVTALALRPRRCFILLGPCGSGKTTVGQALSNKLQGAFIEGDSLHTSAAVAQMRAKIALLDSDRFPWLERVKRRVVETVNELGYENVVVSCSALKKAYRDQLRGLQDSGVEIHFVDLQIDQIQLQERMTERGNHYMSSEMVAGQLELYELPGNAEQDVLPVDADQDVDTIVDEICTLTQA